MTKPRTLNKSKHRNKLEMGLNRLVDRWVDKGFDIHRIWLVLGHVALMRRCTLQDVMIRDGQADIVAANIAKEFQLTGVHPVAFEDPEPEDE